MGKSSTINHLFGANVSRTSATRSETRNATEFVLREDDAELGVKDLSLGVIDTPGEEGGGGGAGGGAGGGGGGGNKSRLRTLLNS